MTLGELWIEFGSRYSELPVVIDINGNGAVPVRGADVIDSGDGNPVIYLTNIEGAKEIYGKENN